MIGAIPKMVGFLATLASSRNVNASVLAKCHPEHREAQVYLTDRNNTKQPNRRCNGAPTEKA